VKRFPPLVLLVLSLVLAASPPTSSATSQRDNWGAIAYSVGTGRWGLVYDYPTQAKAINAAVMRCGVRDCQAAVWFRNGCGAFAKGGRAYGWGIGNSRGEAEEKALAECRKRGPGCRIISWSCTSR
jgi:hypothetical protein